jgi:hypothetical protein
MVEDGVFNFRLAGIYRYSVVTFFFSNEIYIYFSYITVHTLNTVYKMIMIIHHCCSFVIFVIFVIIVVVLSIGTCTSRLNMNSVVTFDTSVTPVVPSREK